MNCALKVGKESAALNRELRALEQQSVPNNHFVGLINEALQFYEENSFNGMFQGNKIHLPIVLSYTLNVLLAIFHAKRVHQQGSRWSHICLL